MRDDLPPRPSGVWPKLWIGYGLSLVAGFLLVDIALQGPSAGYVLLGTWAFVGFWLIETPALRGEAFGGTLTENLQFLYGSTPGGELAALGSYGIVVGLVYLQLVKGYEAGLPLTALVLVFLIVAGWLADHFLAPDSRLWSWARARRSRS